MQLPAGVGESFEVFVNGVVQQPGRDYRREGDELVFERRLAREGRLGFWRWLSLFLGVAGTYRQNDSVDVVYQRGRPADRRDEPAARARGLTAGESRRREQGVSGSQRLRRSYRARARGAKAALWTRSHTFVPRGTCPFQ